MLKSESITALVKAMLAVQAELPALVRQHTATVPTKSGGEYSYQYADLSDLLEACRPILLKHGFVVIQAPEESREGGGGALDGVSLTTLLAHESGEWVEATLVMPCDGNATPQAVGSAITYGRRYGLQSMIGIAAEDDDGKAATDSRSVRQPQARTGDAPKGFCPTHKVPFKQVPAGVSKRTGDPYAAFWACPKGGCKEKPKAASDAAQGVTGQGDDWQGLEEPPEEELAR